VIFGFLAGVKIVGEPVERLEAGLAIKNTPKKTQKTTLKNPLKMFFLFIYFNF
jgi:hypothetical protein